MEAHPDVLQHMRKLGWYDKEGVTILEGKWQDVINNGTTLPEGGFDIVYSDTFSETYQGMYLFNHSFRR